MFTALFSRNIPPQGSPQANPSSQNTNLPGSPITVTRAPSPPSSPVITEEDRKAWFDAAERGDLDAMKALEAKGVPAGLENKEESNAVHFATVCEDEEKGLAVIRYLVKEKDVSATKRNSFGYTPLAFACYYGRLQITRFLIEEAQVPEDSKTNNGYTLIHLACVTANSDLVRYLLANKRGGDINQGREQDGSTPLLTASYKGHLPSVRSLLDCDADIDLSDNENNTAIRQAAQEGRLNVVKELIHRGANLDKRGKAGMTALDMAAGEGFVDIVVALLQGHPDKAGANANLISNRGLTARDYAVNSQKRNQHTDPAKAQRCARIIEIIDEHLRVYPCGFKPKPWRLSATQQTAEQKLMSLRAHFQPKPSAPPLSEISEPRLASSPIEEKAQPVETTKEWVERQNGYFAPRLLSVDREVIEREGDFPTILKGSYLHQAVIIKQAVPLISGNHETQCKNFFLFNEILILSTLSFPNIIAYRGITWFEERPALVIEYARGGSLYSVLHGNNSSLSKPERERLPWLKRYQIALGIALALAYLHNRHPIIIHVDVKSANILLDDNLQPKLADFGLAQTGKASNQLNEFVGTPPYMAPEIKSRGEYSTASDIYAFAMVMYELASYRLPVAVVKDESGRYHSAILDPEARPHFDFISCPASLFPNTMQTCWSQDPRSRLSAEQAGDFLTTLVEGESRSQGLVR